MCTIEEVAEYEIFLKSGSSISGSVDLSIVKLMSSSLQLGGIVSFVDNEGDEVYVVVDNIEAITIKYEKKNIKAGYLYV